MVKEYIEKIRKSTISVKPRISRFSARMPADDAFQRCEHGDCRISASAVLSGPGK
jgi:hypothetical protein